MASLAHPIRVQIIGEIEKRPLGERDFQRLHPTYTLAFVRGHFRRLEKLGYIEAITGPDNRVLYRPAQRALFFDPSALSALGDESAHYTSSICISFAERISEAFASSTFSSHPASRFMWTVLHLNEANWMRAIAATDALFWYSLRIIQDAQERHGNSPDGCRHPVTSGLSCFAAPADSQSVPILPPMAYPVPGTEEGAATLRISTNMAQALNHPIRVRILGALKREPLAPTQISEVYAGASLPTIWKHCLRLEELDCVRRIVERRKGVSPTNIFSLKPQSLFDAATYGNLPGSLRGDVDAVLTSSFVNHVADSILAGSIKARLESHVSWTGFLVDDQGLKELAAAIDAVFLFVLLLERQHSEGGKPLMPVTLGYSCFGSPVDAPRAEMARLQKLYADAPADRRAVEHQWIEDIVSRLGSPNARCPA